LKKEKQKTFIHWAELDDRRARKSAKVFWFFFSKKNILEGPQKCAGQTLTKPVPGNLLCKCATATLRPFAVAMAGEGEFDPFKD
jgi:hypothetical protein